MAEIWIIVERWKHITCNLLKCRVILTEERIKYATNQNELIIRVAMANS